MEWHSLKMVDGVMSPEMQVTSGNRKRRIDSDSPLEASRRNTVLPTPWLQTSHLQKCKKINLCFYVIKLVVICYNRNRKLIQLPSPKFPQLVLVMPELSMSSFPSTKNLYMLFPFPYCFFKDRKILVRHLQCVIWKISD